MTLGDLVGSAAAAAVFTAMAVVLWRAHRDQITADAAARLARCEDCPAVHEGFPGSEGGFRCRRCWIDDVTDVEFRAAARAGLFDIPLEELSRLHTPGGAG